MTNEEKAREIAYKYASTINVISSTVVISTACLEMAQWKDDQLKQVCARCEQHIIDSGRCGCVYRSLSNEYCWED